MNKVHRSFIRQVSAHLSQGRQAAASGLTSRADLFATIGLLFGVVLIAIWASPRAAAERSLSFTIEDAGRPLEGIGTGKLAVFSVDPNAETRRIGFARWIERDILNVSLYGSADVPSGSSSIAVLLHADARLLWAVMSDDNKAQVRDIADSFVQDLRRLFGEIVQSSAFQQRYQRKFEGIVRKASQATMNDPNVKRAVDALPILQMMTDKEFTAKFLAILAKNSARSVGDFIADLSRILAGQHDDRAPRRKNGNVFDTPEMRKLIAERVSDILRSDEFARMIAEFGSPFVANLASDPELIAALREVASDPAFARQISEIERLAVERARAVAKLLVGLDRQDRMHPLAATILRGLLFGHSTWLVAFVTRENLRELRSSTPAGVVDLVNEVRP